jgi:beta-RFAP synthase
MISEPALRIRATASDRFAVSGPSADRAANVVSQLVVSHHFRAVPRCRVEILAAPPPHSGLGSGTQLSLAVATAVLNLAGVSPSDAAELARPIGRGRRSAIGTHGFAQGGLLVDSGKSSPDVVAPLAARAALDAHWRVLVLLPRGDRGLAGDAEDRAFARLPVVAKSTTARLRQLALDEIVPAAKAADFERFSSAVSRFNALSGECFAAVQGGPYASPLAARWIERLGELGAPAGQSSWGPTLFAFAPNEHEARRLAAAIRAEAHEETLGNALGGGWDVLVTRPMNTGAIVEIS